MPEWKWKLQDSGSYDGAVVQEQTILWYHASPFNPHLENGGEQTFEDFIRDGGGRDMPGEMLAELTIEVRKRLDECGGTDVFNNLEEALAKPERARVLSLVSGAGAPRLKALPDAIGSLTKLEVLVLREHDIVELPSSIGQLEALTELDLRNNVQLKKLPPEMERLTKLRSLFFTSSWSLDFSEVITRLTGLRVLEFWSSMVKSLPSDIGRLNQLESLDLTGNQLKDLPAEFAQLRGLRNLNLTANQFEALPEPVLALEGLSVLEARANKITSVPEGIRRLVNLKRLDLAGNPLKSVPEGLSIPELRTS